MSCNIGVGVLKHGVSHIGDARGPLEAGRTADWSTFDTAFHLQRWSFGAFCDGCRCSDEISLWHHRCAFAALELACSSSIGAGPLQIKGIEMNTQLFYG
jgi:hypothetical protein